MDGVLNIRKEKGYTSFDVVAKLRGILHMKKIGHTGTAAACGNCKSNRCTASGHSCR